MGHCLGSILFLSSHLCPHFRHIQSTTFLLSLQISVSALRTLNIFHREGAFVVLENFPRLELSSSSTCFFCRFDVNFFWYERNFVAAFGTFTVVSLNYLVWGFQFWPFVENKTAFFANYLLRQDLTAVSEKIQPLQPIYILWLTVKLSLQEPFVLPNFCLKLE